MVGDDRLIGEEDAALVERGDDLVGDPGLAPARLRLRLVGGVHGDRAAPPREAAASASSARCSSRWAVRPWRGLSATPTRVGARIGPAEVGWNSALARCGDARRRDRRLVVGRQRDQQRELAAAIAHELVAAAQARRQLATDAGDQFVADVVAVARVDLGEIADADHHHAPARSPGARGSAQRLSTQALKARREPMAPARMRLAARSSGAGAAQHPHHAVHAARPAVGVGEPAAEILDRRSPRSSPALEPVVDAERRALALVAAQAVEHRVIARGLRNRR